MIKNIFHPRNLLLNSTDDNNPLWDRFFNLCIVPIVIAFFKDKLSIGDVILGCIILYTTMLLRVLDKNINPISSRAFKLTNYVRLGLKNCSLRRTLQYIFSNSSKEAVIHHMSCG